MLRTNNPVMLMVALSDNGGLTKQITGIRQFLLISQNYQNRINLSGLAVGSHSTTVNSGKGDWRSRLQEQVRKRRG